MVTDQGNVVCEMVVNVAGVRQARRKGCVYTEANGWERPKWFSPDGREKEVGFRHNNVSEVVGEECRRHQRLGVLVLAGPRSREVLAKLTDAELGNGRFRWLTDREIRHRPAPFPHKYYGSRVGLYQERRRGQGGMGSPGRRYCPRRKRAVNRLLRHRPIHLPLRLRFACMRHSQLEGDAPTVAASIAERHGTWSCYP